MRSIFFAILAVLAQGCAAEHEYPNIVVPAQKLSGTDPVVFADVMDYVFVPYCIRCHEGKNPEAPDMTNYKAILNDEDMVHPGDPEHSEIFTDVRDDLMPKRGRKLSADQKRLVYLWIKGGAL